MSEAAKLIVPAARPLRLHKNCGSCLHYEPEGGVCFGAPPVAVLLGAQQNQFTRKMDFRFENIRPHGIKPNERACSRHEPDPDKMSSAAMELAVKGE
jgi:hypothetical protein